MSTVPWRAGWRLLAAVLVAAAAACDAAPAGPSQPPPSPPAASPPTRLEISGPKTVAPGTSASFAAIVHDDAGVTRDVTSTAAWRSNSSVLNVIGPGQVSAGTRAGEASLAVAFGALSSVREVIVVPEGTYRLAGTVTDPEPPAGPIALASVRVLSGTGRGLTTHTGTSGQYSLYGLAGDTTIRVEKFGYIVRDLTVTVADHQVENVELRILVRRPDLSGAYVMRVEADDDCRSALPEDVWSRTYDVQVTQVGHQLSAHFSGPTYAWFNGTFHAASTLTVAGQVDPTSVRVSLGSLGCFGYYYGCGPALAERIGSSRYFMPTGSATLLLEGANLTGALDGTLEVRTVPGPRQTTVEASCRSPRHRLSLVR